MAICPACSGTGELDESEYHLVVGALTRHARLLNKWDEAPKKRGNLCSCDGPPHAYDPDWCKV